VLFSNSVKAWDVALLAFLVMSLPSPVRANDTTVPCKNPPDKSASVAVHPGSQVSSTQDKQEKTCVFSINGAVATSPPAVDVINAVNTFRDATKPYLTEQSRAVSAVATLLAVAAPVERVPSELLELMNKFAPSLTKCLVGLSPGTFSTERYGEGPFSCRGIAPYSNDANPL
jgi:hypothetical protein